MGKRLVGALLDMGHPFRRERAESRFVASVSATNQPTPPQVGVLCQECVENGSDIMRGRRSIPRRVGGHGRLLAQLLTTKRQTLTGSGLDHLVQTFSRNRWGRHQDQQAVGRGEAARWLPQIG